MNQLKEMLEAYRNGERGLPTYDELAAIAYADQKKSESGISEGGRAFIEAFRADVFKSKKIA